MDASAAALVGLVDRASCPAEMVERESYELGTPCLRLEREGHLAWCTIDRPTSRNALSSAMYFGLKRAVQLVNAMAEPTALLITGVAPPLRSGSAGGRAARGRRCKVRPLAS